MRTIHLFEGLDYEGKEESVTLVVSEVNALEKRENESGDANRHDITIYLKAGQTIFLSGVSSRNLDFFWDKWGDLNHEDKE